MAYDTDRDCRGGLCLVPIDMFFKGKKIIKFIFILPHDEMSAYTESSQVLGLASIEKKKIQHR